MVTTVIAGLVAAVGAVEEPSYENGGLIAFEEYIIAAEEEHSKSDHHTDHGLDLADPFMIVAAIEAVYVESPLALFEGEHGWSKFVDHPPVGPQVQRKP